MTKRLLEYHSDVDYDVAINVFLQNYVLTVLDTPFKLDSYVIICYRLVCKFINNFYETAVRPELDKITQKLDYEKDTNNLGSIDISDVLRLFRANKNLVTSIVTRNLLSRRITAKCCVLSLYNANVINLNDPQPVNVMTESDSRLFFYHYISYCPLTLINDDNNRAVDTMVKHFVAIREEQDKYEFLCEQIIRLTEEKEYLCDSTQEQKELRFMTITELLKECVTSLVSIRVVTHNLTRDLTVYDEEFNLNTDPGHLNTVIQNAVIPHFDVDYLLGYIGYIVRYIPIKKIMDGDSILCSLASVYASRPVIHNGLAQGIALYYRKNLETLGKDFEKLVTDFHFYIHNNEKNAFCRLLPLTVLLNLLFTELQWIPDKVLPLLKECEQTIQRILKKDQGRAIFQPIVNRQIVDNFVTHIRFCVQKGRHRDIVELINSPIMQEIVCAPHRKYLNEQLNPILLEILEETHPLPVRCDLLTEFSILCYLDQENATSNCFSDNRSYFKEFHIRIVLSSKSPKEVIRFLNQLRQSPALKNYWEMGYFTHTLINEYILTLIYNNHPTSKQQHLRHLHQITELFMLNYQESSTFGALNQNLKDTGDLVVLKPKSIQSSIDIYLNNITDDESYCSHCKAPILKCIWKVKQFVSSVRALSLKYTTTLETRWISIVKRLIIEVITEQDMRELAIKEERDEYMRLIETDDYGDDTNDLINHVDWSDI
jgi:hypothetical protein